MSSNAQNPKPTADLIFRKLFGSEENKDLLVALINSVVGPHLTLTEAEIKNPFNLADYKGAKESIVDIKARADDGAWYIIEMQLLWHLAYSERALFSTAKGYVDQLAAAKKYAALNPTIGIHFLGFNLFKDYRLLHRLALKDWETNEHYEQFRHLQLFFIEMDKFNLDWSVLTTARDQWLAFLTVGQDLHTSSLPAVLRTQPAIVKAVSELERMGEDSEVREIYEAEEKARMVDISQLEHARAEGISQGAVREAQSLLLRMGETRLGKPASETVEWIRANTSLEDLETMILRLFSVESWDELLV